MAGCGVPSSPEEAAEMIRRFRELELTEGEARAMSNCISLPLPKMANFKAKSADDELAIGQFVEDTV